MLGLPGWTCDCSAPLWWWLVRPLVLWSPGCSRTLSGSSGCSVKQVGSWLWWGYIIKNKHEALWGWRRCCQPSVPLSVGKNSKALFKFHNLIIFKSVLSPHCYKTSSSLCTDASGFGCYVLIYHDPSVAHSKSTGVSVCIPIMLYSLAVVQLINFSHQSICFGVPLSNTTSSDAAAESLCHTAAQLEATSWQQRHERPQLVPRLSRPGNRCQPPWRMSTVLS